MRSQTTMLDPTTLLETATAAARLGGEVLMRYFRDGVTIRDKSESGGKTYDLVSDADIDSEREIEGLLRKTHPEHELLGEENLTEASTDAENLWVIDPLDGTNNFAHGLPHFAVSIAFYRLGEPLVGVVLNPARDEWFTAVRGQGAFFNGRPARVCEAAKLSKTLIGCGFYYDRGSMMRSTLSAIEAFFGEDIHGIRRFGTAALDLCQVGCGQFGGFFEYQLSPWDFAAGRLFVEEAGGRVTDGRGKPLELQTSSVLASNGPLHDAMLEITTSHHP